MQIERVTDFKPEPAAWTFFRQDRNGEVGKYLVGRAQKLTALAKTSVPREYGALADSIGWTYTPGLAPFVKIGSDLRYSYMVHEGTEPHQILPAPGKVLRFTVKGRVVYARRVNHPGTKPQRYLSDHLRKVVR